MTLTFRNLARNFLAASVAAQACLVHAHDGHGLDGSHWHATDTAGFLVVLGIAVALFVISRRDK